MSIQSAYIEITNKCNFNCITCYNRSGLDSNIQEISPQKLHDIIQLLSCHGVKHILLSGGEPTLHPHFNEILEIIDNNPDISFTLITNGSSRNPKLFKLLDYAKNLTLQVSVDGANEQQNSIIRGKGNFNRAIEFLRIIKTPHKRPFLKMVITQSNINGISDFYNLALSLGCTPSYSFVSNMGNGSENWSSKVITSQQKMYVYKCIKNLNEKTGFYSPLPHCTFKCPFLSSNVPLSICIKVDGAIQPCQMLYSSQYTLGNIFYFDEKKYLENLQRITHLAHQRTQMDYGCSKCMLDNFCDRGCIAEAINVSGDPLKEDGSCMYRKLLFAHYIIEEKTKERK